VKHNCDNFDKNICKSCSLLPSVSSLPLIPDELRKLTASTRGWVKNSNPFGLRSKARIIVTNDDNQLKLGILDKDLKGISLLDCPLHRPIINEILRELPQLIEDFKISVYSIKKRSGELKNLILQTSQNEETVRIRFQLRSIAEVEQIEHLVQELSKNDSRKIIASANIQPIPHQIAEGDQEIHLYGEEFLWEKYNNIEIAFPSQSFMQVTPEIAAQLYLEAKKIVEKVKSEKVLDLFCGAGGFALNIANSATKVLGADISSKAIEAAAISAKKNSISNCEFQTLDLLNNLDVLESFNPDVLICNPPRRGLGEKLIREIIKIKPETLIYSSCNVESFLKDYAKIACAYKIAEVTPFEMFPLTNHFEILVHLTKVS